MNKNEKNGCNTFTKKILETGLCRIVSGFTGPLKAKVSLHFKWNGKPWRDWNREIMTFNFPFIITLWKSDCNDARVWSQSLIRHYCFSLARIHRPAYIMEWMGKAVIIFWMRFNSWNKGSGWSSWRREGEGEWWKRHLGRRAIMAWVRNLESRRMAPTKISSNSGKLLLYSDWWLL